VWQDPIAGSWFRSVAYQLQGLGEHDLLHQLFQGHGIDMHEFFGFWG
jgi:hypothetical protein